MKDSQNILDAMNDLERAIREKDAPVIEAGLKVFIDQDHLPRATTMLRTRFKNAMAESWQILDLAGIPNTEIEVALLKRLDEKRIRTAEPRKCTNTVYITAPHGVHIPPPHQEKKRRDTSILKFIGIKP